LKSSEFPTDLAGQNARATEVVKELMVKILGREESFKVAVRRGANTLRRARDSTLFLLPPIEVGTLIVFREIEERSKLFIILLG
jgi:hypothetical protein